LHKGLYQEYVWVPLTYLLISVIALFRLLITPGVVSQGDWGIPLTSTAAIHSFLSGFYIWQLYGFGSPGSSFFYFNLLYPVLSPLGFYGGGMVKAISVGYLFISGTGMYFFVREQGAGRAASFISGLVYMLSPMVLDQLVYGWINYLMGYTLLPFFLLLLLKFMKKKDIRYVLVAGVIEALALWRPSEIVTYTLLSLILSVIYGYRSRIARGLLFIMGSTAIALASNVYYFFPLSFSGTLESASYAGSFLGSLLQYHRIASIPVLLRLGGLYMNSIYSSYFTSWSYPFLYIVLIFVPIAILLNWRNRAAYFFLASYLLLFLGYLVYTNYSFFVYHIPYGVIFEGLNPLLFPGAIGLAGLVGYSVEGIVSKKRVRGAALVVFFIVAVWAYPWWTGQFVGPQTSGIPQKLSIYSIPKSYLDWSRKVNATSGFVLYYPGGSYVLINYENFTHAVNGAIFYNTNDLPPISQNIATVITYWIISKVYNATEVLAQLGIKNYVLYLDVPGVYNSTEIMQAMNQSKGVDLVMKNSDIAVYRIPEALPLIFSNGSKIAITSCSPSGYTLKVDAEKSTRIVLLQSYDPRWVAYANGLMVKNQQINIYGFAFNSWVLRGNESYTVKIVYLPQYQYVIYLGASIAAFFFSVFTAIAMTIAGYINKRKSKLC